MAGPSFNPIPSSIQISRMLRRAPPVGGIAFHSGVSQRPPALKRASGGAVPDDPMRPITGAVPTATPGRADAHPTHVPGQSYVLPADFVSAIGEGNTAAGLDILKKMFAPMQGQGGQLGMMAQGAPFGAGGAPFGAASPKLSGSPLGPPPGIRPKVAGMPQYTIYAGLHGSEGRPTYSRPDAHGGVVPGEPGPAFLDRMGVGQKPGTPINISGGEFVIRPDEVKRQGRGDINRGHEILDGWVNHVRAEHIKTLKRLPGPAK